MNNDQEEGQDRQRPLWRRLLWLLALWSASVLTLTLVAYGLRLIMNAAGLHTPQ